MALGLLPQAVAVAVEPQPLAAAVEPLAAAVEPQAVAVEPQAVAVEPQAVVLTAAQMEVLMAVVQVDSLFRRQVLHL